MKKFLTTIFLISSLIIPEMSLATTTTFYPAAGANSPVDGYIQRTDNPSNWATTHDAASGSATDPTSANFWAYNYLNKYGGYSSIGRGIALFDTSALTSSAVISAVTFSCYDDIASGGVIDNSHDGYDYVAIVSSTPAANNNLVIGDYSQLGTTAFVTTTLNGMGTNQYHDFALNASGIASVNKTGISKFGMRLGHDLENVAIGSGVEDDFLCFSADNASGTAKSPKLTITYTTSTASKAKRKPIIIQ